MALTNAGRDFIAAAIIGNGTDFNNTNAKLCIGDSTVAFAPTQTDLQAITNTLRKAMDTLYPTIAANALTFKATFEATEGNFPWNEWGIANADSAGTLLNRVVEYNGTKLSGQTWVFQVTLTVNIGT